MVQLPQPALTAAITTFLSSANSATSGFDTTALSSRLAMKLGSAVDPPTSFQSDSAFSGNRLYYFLQDCTNFAYAPLITAMVPGGNVTCVNMPFVQRAGASDLNQLMYGGYYESGTTRQSADVGPAYNFLTTSIVAGSPSTSVLSVDVFFNKTKEGQGNAGNGPPPYTSRVSAMTNTVTNTYLKQGAPVGPVSLFQTRCILKLRSAHVRSAHS